METIMPNFSAASLSKLATCHPELQILMHEVIKHRDCTIIEGHRGEAAQEAAYAAGNSKLHYPLGNHNASPSNAVDVLAYPIEWNNNPRNIEFAGFVLGVAKMLYVQGKMSHHIRWGGVWGTDASKPLAHFADLPHFEIIP